MQNRFETDERFYEFSMWNRWQQRAETGRLEDEQRIQCEANEGIGPDVREDWIDEEMWLANRLTNAMFASLVVTSWSEMEHFLKGLIEECQSRLGSAVRIPFKFREIKKYLRDNLGVDVDTFPDFPTVDAVRILNNSFKHSDGVYSPQINQPHTIIDSGLLTEWSILDSSNRIDYSKLPLKDLILACGRFAKQLTIATSSAGGK